MSIQDNPENKKRKRLTPQESFVRISRYCAYQERSHLEVRRKLFSYGLFPSEVDELLTRLITDGFLNEERFAKAFAGGKFRMKKWGRYKIKKALESHGLTTRCIQRGLNEIDSASYSKTLTNLLVKKLGSLKEENPLKKRQKAGTFAIGKGYEPERVWTILKELSEE